MSKPVSVATVNQAQCVPGPTTSLVGFLMLLTVKNAPYFVAASSQLAAAYTAGGYGALKSDTADAVVEFLAPIQARYAELAADPGHVDDVLGDGAGKAETIADDVLERVRSAAGLLPRRSRV